MSQEILQYILSISAMIIVFLIRRYFATIAEQEAIRVKTATYWGYANTAVRFAEDIFKNNPEKLATISKLQFAMDYMMTELEKLGFDISTLDAEAQVRAAFQDSDYNKDLTTKVRSTATETVNTK